MSYRYFSWIEEGRWQGNCLLSKQQIATLLQQFRWRYPVFVSTQTYDSEGRVISCPLYFDIDGTSKEGFTADFMARQVVEGIEQSWNVTPDIFFSGNKGYHIIVPIEITDPLCHYVVMTMVQGLGCTGYSNIDRRVYRNRAMFRINKSPASREGFYKIRLSRADLFEHDLETHRQFATSNTTDVKSEFDMGKLNTDNWYSDVELAKKHMSKNALNYSQIPADEMRKIRPWTPCLQGLMVSTPESGERHASSFLIARWAMQAGVDEETCLKQFLAYDHWQSFEKDEKGISKMIRSLYKSGRVPTLGCKYPSIDRDMMKRHCDPLCHYNDDWSLFG